MATISAIVATYNRADVLRRCLRELLAQSRPPDDILVIDDASPDHTRQMMRDEFPDIRYLRMPQNMGQAFGRNLGVTSTRSEYILSIDDDAWFEHKDGLAEALAAIESDSTIGIIALNVRLPNGWLFMPETMGSRNVSAYIGCACLLRRAVAENTLYIPEMRGNGEESDRAVRVYDMGYGVRGLPRVIMFHQLSTLNRNWERFRFTLHRNGLIRELARCPLALLPWRFVWTWAGNTLANLREGHFLVDVKVVLSLPMIFCIGLRHRAPVSLANYRLWRAIVARDGVELPGGQGPRHFGNQGT